MTVTELKAPREKNFKNLSIRFSIRINYVLFPFEILELIDILRKSGYTPTPLPPAIPPPRGMRLGMTGTIARKGDVIIDINDERGILTVTAPSSTLAVDEFNEILQLIRINLNVDLDEMASFYELIGHVEADTDQRAIENIGLLVKGNKKVEEFASILGNDISLFTLRLAPTGQVPNQTEWFDITIEPSVVKPSTYNIQAVYRSHDKSKVQKFTEDFISKISKIIDVIESA